MHRVDIECPDIRQVSNITISESTIIRHFLHAAPREAADNPTPGGGHDQDEEQENNTVTLSGKNKLVIRYNNKKRRPRVLPGHSRHLSL